MDLVYDLRELAGCGVIALAIVWVALLVWLYRREF